MTSYRTWKRPVSAGDNRARPWASFDTAQLQRYRNMDTGGGEEARGRPTWHDEPRIRRGRPDRALIQNPDVGNAILVDNALDLMRDSLMSTLARCRQGRRVVRTDPNEQYVFERVRTLTQTGSDDMSPTITRRWLNCD